MTPRSRRCFITHTEYRSITPSEKACLSVSRRRLCPDRTGRSVGERTGRPVGPSGQELNVGNTQIRTLLDKQKEKIFAECQAEIQKHEFQADYDRRSIQKLNDMIESRRGVIYRAHQGDERRRQDLQLLHEQV